MNSFIFPEINESLILEKNGIKYLEWSIDNIREKLADHYSFNFEKYMSRLESLVRDKALYESAKYGYTYIGEIKRTSDIYRSLGGGERYGDRVTVRVYRSDEDRDSLERYEV